MRQIILIILLSVCKSMTAQDRGIWLAKGLLDSTNTATLGLSKAEAVETFTVFTPTDQSDHYANGVIITDFKGVLYCMWQSSPTDEDSDDTWVAYSQSKDGGATWSSAKPLALPSPTYYCTSGGWMVNGDTLIAMVDTWEKGLSPRGGKTLYMTSTDGQTWSRLRPVTMADGQEMNGVLEQDPMLLPTGRLVGAVHFQPGLHVCPVYTDDRTGRSGWRRGSFQATDMGKQSRELEPSQYLQPDGTAVMLFRDQKSSFRKLASFSYDEGLSWTPPTITDIPDARTKQCAGNLPEGTAYMVCCPVKSKQRYPLVLLLSKDGQHFDQAMLLCSGDELPAKRYEGRYKTIGYSYPKAIVSNSYLYIGYSVNKETVACSRVKLK